MKILFTSSGQGVDYMADALFHGLRSLLGPEVVDYPKVWHMYEDSFVNGLDPSQLYGRGFTFSKLFPDDKGIDRDDLVKKLHSRYFDMVIYGSIHRNQSWFGGVAMTYKPSQIAFVDGEDHPYVFLFHKHGAIFKRELHNPCPGVYPIQFGIPKQKILKSRPAKQNLMAPYDPLNNQGYVYDNESAYYQQYADSYFGATMKKGGWDCLRHYEIMANYCIPYFRCFEACPTTVAQFLPRRELSLVKEVLEYGELTGWSDKKTKLATDAYELSIEPVMKTLHEHMTTEKVAEYVLDTMKQLAA